MPIKKLVDDIFRFTLIVLNSSYNLLEFVVYLCLVYSLWPHFTFWTILDLTSHFFNIFFVDIFMNFKLFQKKLVDFLYIVLMILWYLFFTLCSHLFYSFKKYVFCKFLYTFCTVFVNFQKKMDSTNSIFLILPISRFQKSNRSKTNLERHYNRVVV